MIFLISLVLAIFVLDSPWSWVVLVIGGLLEFVETGLWLW